MQIVKDEVTMRLDDVTRLVDETLTSFDDLLDQLEDRTLRNDVAENVRAKRAALEDLMRARRARNELPQVGNVERGHVLALFTALEALFAADDTPAVQKLIDGNAEIGRAARAASRIELPREEQEPIARLIASCESMDALLRGHARASSS